MDPFSHKSAPQQFKTPEDEVAFLREKLRTREEELKSKGIESKEGEIARAVLEEYKKAPTAEVLHPENIVSKEEHEKIVLRLSPEPHDKKMEELLSVMMMKGIKNAMDLVEKINNPHIDDDFHRFLVQYLFSMGSIPGLKENTPLSKSLKMVLYEVTLPDDGKPSEKGFKEFLGAMEQFFAGMQSVGDGRDNYGKDYFVIEIAMSNNSGEIVVYTAVPISKKDVFEKQILSFYSKARIIEVVDDYNIFTENGASSGSYCKLSGKQVFPIRTYDKLEHDPMNALLNVFSKIKKEGEGASIQFIITPAGDSFTKKFHYVLDSVKSGKSLKDAMSIFGGIHKQIGKTLKELVMGVKQKGEGDEKKTDDNAMEKIGEKVKSTIMSASIRIITSAETKERSEQILHEIESSFNQFTEPDSNSFIFSRVKKESALKKILHEFSFRLQDDEENMPLNFKELATIFHFPVGVSSSPILRQAKAAGAPAPLNVPPKGILIGYNEYRGVKTEIRMTEDDRLRHFYVIGQTGTGKTTILKTMIAQDIKNGDGCCFIDPHGNDVVDLLGMIPPERINDVIYFDPSYTARPMGLNMLEFDVTKSDQKTFVVNELLKIFTQLFGSGADGGMGPAFEQYFRNSALLVMSHPESGNTLLEISRVLIDEEFREYKLSKVTDPVLIQFWKGAKNVTGEAGLANWVPYITNKFDVFLTNDIMRPVVLQEKSVFDFRKIMDEKKILLVNLSKGKLGEINASLIGLILVGKLQMAALSRADSPGKKFPNFYMYMDEFQNITTDSIASILSEARKYKLSLTMAHQFLGQLKENIKKAVFGNVGNMAFYRIDPEDAEVAVKQLDPVFTVSDIVKLEMFDSYVKVLINGAPTKPFSMTSHYNLQPKINKDIIEKIKELSYLKYGRDRNEIEAEIKQKYTSL